MLLGFGIYLFFYAGIGILTKLIIPAIGIIGLFISWIDVRHEHGTKIFGKYSEYIYVFSYNMAFYCLS